MDELIAEQLLDSATEDSVPAFYRLRVVRMQNTMYFDASVISSSTFDTVHVVIDRFVGPFVLRIRAGESWTNS